MVLSKISLVHLLLLEDQEVVETSAFPEDVETEEGVLQLILLRLQLLQDQGANRALLEEVEEAEEDLQSIPEIHQQEDLQHVLVKDNLGVQAEHQVQTAPFRVVEEEEDRHLTDVDLLQETGETGLRVE